LYLDHRAAESLDVAGHGRVVIAARRMAALNIVVVSDKSRRANFGSEKNSDNYVSKSNITGWG
jgi:hypothetical protein